MRVRACNVLHLMHVPISTRNSSIGAFASGNLPRHFHLMHEGGNRQGTCMRLCYRFTKPTSSMLPAKGANKTCKHKDRYPAQTGSKRNSASHAKAKSSKCCLVLNDRTTLQPGLLVHLTVYVPVLLELNSFCCAVCFENCPFLRPRSPPSCRPAVRSCVLCEPHRSRPSLPCRHLPSFTRACSVWTLLPPLAVLPHSCALERMDPKPHASSICSRSNNAGIVSAGRRTSLATFHNTTRLSTMSIYLSSRQLRADASLPANRDAVATGQSQCLFLAHRRPR